MTADTPEGPGLPLPARQEVMTTVALVEDSAPLRRNLERMLRRAPGVRCICSCGTAEAALEQIPRSRPDVVLMDINLPGASGIECTARLKSQLPAMQVIMLTVYEDTASIFSALKAGACGYLLKRSSPAEILEALTTVQTGGVPMTSEIARKIVMTFQSPCPARGRRPPCRCGNRKSWICCRRARSARRSPIIWPSVTTRSVCIPNTSTRSCMCVPAPRPY